MSVIVTGSSSLDLLQSAGEPLTGRKTTVPLYPISVQESLSVTGRRDAAPHLSDYLRYGMYPAVLTATTFREKESIGS